MSSLALRVQSSSRFARLIKGAGSAALPALVTLTAIGQAADPVVGTWQTKATAPAVGAEPIVITTRIDRVPDGIRLVSESRDTEGRVTRREYTARFDGKDYPVVGTIDGQVDPNAPDAIAVRKVDDYNYELSSKLRGQPVTVTRWSISENARIRTASCLPATAEHSCPATLVFEKQ